MILKNRALSTSIEFFSKKVGLSNFFPNQTRSGLFFPFRILDSALLVIFWGESWVNVFPNHCHCVEYQGLFDTSSLYCSFVLFSCELLLLFSSSGRLLRRIFIPYPFCHNKPDGKEAWAPQLCRRLHQEAQSQSLLLGKNLARWSWPEVAQSHGWQGHIDPRGDHQVGHRLDQLQQVSVIVSVLEQMVEKCTRMNFLVVN